MFFTKKLSMKLVFNAYLVSTVGTDGLVLWYQGISSHSADQTPTNFEMIMN